MVLANFEPDWTVNSYNGAASVVAGAAVFALKKVKGASIFQSGRYVLVNR